MAPSRRNAGQVADVVRRVVKKARRGKRRASRTTQPFGSCHQNVSPRVTCIELWRVHATAKSRNCDGSEMFQVWRREIAALPRRIRCNISPAATYSE
jgi:hypothetical protein